MLAGIAVNDRLALLYALWSAALPLAVAFLVPDFEGYNTTQDCMVTIRCCAP